MKTPLPPLIQNGCRIETSGLRRAVATVPHKASPIPVPDAAADSLTEAHAIAALIIHRFNSFEAMREAIDYTAATLGKVPAFGDGIGADVSKAQLGVALNKLRAALALADGKGEA